MTNFLRHKFNTTLIERIGGLSYKQAAEISGVSDRTMQRILSKKIQARNIMSLRIFMELCDFMNADPSGFFMTRNDPGVMLSPAELAKYAIMECTDIPLNKREEFVKIFESLSRGE